MSELRLRDEQGRFASGAEESNYMNSIFKSLCGLQPATEPTPAPTTPANSGLPVPPGAGPDLPAEDESKVMNRALKQMCGIADDNSR